MSERKDVIKPADVICTSRAQTIGTVLSKYYFDFPLSRLPAWAVLSYARRWKTLDTVFYIEARSPDGGFLGFIFGHRLGSQPWRVLLSDPKWLTPLALMLFVMKKLKERPTPDVENIDLPPSPPQRSITTTKPDESQPYVMVEQVFTSAQARGNGIAGIMLEAIEQQARAANILLLKAHIAAKNHASQVAFQRAGWSIKPTSPTSLEAFKEL